MIYKIISKKKGKGNMSEIEYLEIELKDLDNAQKDIVSAMNNITDVEGLDKEYAELSLILEALEERMSDIRIELNNLEDEAYYKENEEQWESEKREQENEYWREVL